MPLETIFSGARIGNPGNWSGGCGALMEAANGAIYWVVQNTSDNDIQLMKRASDGTWSEQDAANSPTAFDQTRPFFGRLELTNRRYIYVFYFSATATGRVRRFDTQTDTWDAGDIGNADAVVAASTTSSFRLDVRSDGDVLVLTGGTALNVRRYEGASWANTSVFAGAARPNDFRIIANDRGWATYADDANDDASYNPFSSANSTGTQADFDTTAHTTDQFRGTQDETFLSNGNVLLFHLKRDTGAEGDGHHGIVTDAQTLGSVAVINGVIADTGVLTTSVAAVAADGKLHVIWAIANTIKYISTTSLDDLTFGTAVTLRSSMTDSDPVPMGIKNNDGTAWGVVHEETVGGTLTVRVDWVIAPAPPGTFVDVPLGNLALTGLAPTDLVNPTAPLGSLTISGLAPTDLVNPTAPLGSLTMSGLAPVATVIETVPLGTLTIEGLAPSTSLPTLVDVPLGTLMLSGLEPGKALAMPQGQLSLTGLAPTDAITETVPLGSLALTGLAPTDRVAPVVPLGTLTLSGLEPGKALAMPLGALAITGLAPQMRVAESVPLGTLTLFGLAPTSGQVTNVDVPLGTLSLSGLAPIDRIEANVPLGNLIFTGLAPQDRTIVSVPLGALALGGLAPLASISNQVPLGQLTLVGQIPGYALAVNVPTGELLLIGLAPGIAGAAEPVVVAVPVRGVAVRTSGRLGVSAKIRNVNVEVKD